jgi:phosphoribosyl 1,2-cyclic phosphodiesterase
MRFVSLGSGSRGNATLVEAQGTRVLLDCGFPAREAEQRLSAAGVDPATLDAVLVTHEHGDHLRGVGALARRHRLPVYMTAGTRRAGRCGVLEAIGSLDPHGGPLPIGDLRARPLAVPHDACEPVQFVLEAGGLKLGVLTDTGRITPHILESLNDCDALILECNHDSRLLAEGPYPPPLKARVGGPLGHLSNDQAAALLGGLDHGRLRCLVAAHLSEKNNRPELARDALLEAAPALEPRLFLLEQDRVSTWFEL